MKYKMLLTALLFLLAWGSVQAEDMVAVSVFDVKLDRNLVQGKDTIIIDTDSPREYLLQISIGNDTALGGFTTGFMFYCRDNKNLEINWLKQKGGWGPKGRDLGTASLTVVPDSRMDPANEIWDYEESGILIKEASMDGQLPDSILYGGFSVGPNGLATGPVQHMLSTHFSLSGLGKSDIATLCIDSVFIPQGGAWLFVSKAGDSSKMGSSWPPAFSGKICFPVRDKAYAPAKGDIDRPSPIYGLKADSDD